MENGWIKLYRKIQDSEIWDSDPIKEPFDKRSAWVDIILDVNHEDKTIAIGYNTLKVSRGQKFTSIRKLAEKWGWSRNKTSRYLNLLEKLGMISKSETLNGTLITVKNYSEYQGFSDSSKKKRDTKRDTTEATDVTLSRHECSTNNKDIAKAISKNEKKEKNKGIVLSDEKTIEVEMMRNQ